MSVVQFLRVLRARLRWVLLVFMAVVAVSFAAAWYAPRFFEATAVVLVDFKEPISGEELDPFGLDDYLTTQLDIIQSRRVALEALKELQPGMDDASRAARLIAVQKKLSAELSNRGSRVIDITYRAEEPETAAQYANAFAEAYRRTALELSVEPAARTAEWLEKQMAELLSKRQEAQHTLTAYQQQQGILATDERVDIETDRLTTLTQELIAAQARTQEAESRLREMKELQAQNRLPGLIPQLLASTQEFLDDRTQIQEAESQVHALTNRPDLNPGTVDLSRKLLPSNLDVRDLRDRLVVWETRLKEISEAHPDYKRILAEVQTLRKDLQTEVDGLFMTLERDVAVARAREDAVKASLAEQRSRILQLQRARDQIPALLNEVQAAQQAYETARARYDDYRMQSQANVTNVSILSPAFSPKSPLNPPLPLVLVASVIVGIILGVGVALLMEMLDRRIHSREDVTDRLGMPLLLELHP
ncbi:MAG: GNVR domain-containing protein [Gammaproteobacteria bacterium]